ncbi:MAG: hypothetical protein ACREAB_04320 [Blastocatellia bacterium]
MKDRIFNHPPYRAGLSVLAALCLLTGFNRNPAAINHDHAKRQIVYADVPSGLCEWLEKQGVSANNFSDHIAAINRSTAERELRGEYDHLIFFLLQSRRFTRQTKIEPALSAYEFVNGLSEPEKGRYLAERPDYLPLEEKMPKAARDRMNEFIRALDKGSDDERMIYFKTLLKKTAPKSFSFAQHLYAEYARAMRFLYLKEFASRKFGKERFATYIASLYQDRGHSTDTQIESNFVVYTALAALKAGEKAQSPSTQLNKVLIIGPGLDFAPRTDFVDLFGPQSYQPFAVADALLSLKLCDAARLQIDCVDINERVVAHLQSLRQRGEVTLSILSGVNDGARRPLSEDYKDYFRNLGRGIGQESVIDVPSDLALRLKKSLRIGPEITGRINASRLNIITERFERSDGSTPNYDLVIVTNVFPYFDPTELLFALTNISAMLAEGGYLIHNELQAVPSSFVTPLGLPLRQARTVLIAYNENAPLFDGVAIHQKTKK